MRTISAMLGIALAALPALAFADPYADIGKYQKAFLALHSYRSSMQTQTGGNTITTTTEYVAPDRYHSTASGTEMINIGSDTWYHVGGRWSKMPKSVGGYTMPNVSGFSLGQVTDPASTLLLHASARNVCTAADLGMRDGYHAIACQASSNGVSATITLWLRPDFLPAKIQMTGSTGTTTTTYSDFNTPITIAAPQ